MSGQGVDSEGKTARPCVDFLLNQILTYLAIGIGFFVVIALVSAEDEILMALSAVAGASLLLRAIRVSITCETDVLVIRNTSRTHRVSYQDIARVDTTRREWWKALSPLPQDFAMLALVLADGARIVMAGSATRPDVEAFAGRDRLGEWRRHQRNVTRLNNALAPHGLQVPESFAAGRAFDST